MAGQAWSSLPGWAHQYLDGMSTPSRLRLLIRNFVSPVRTSTQSAALVADLENELKQHFAGPDPEWIPLHWFWLLKPLCSQCKMTGLLYKDLIIATSSGKQGSVVRDDAMQAFCPICLTVHQLGSGRKVFNCCGRRHNLNKGTFRRGKYVCPGCGKASSHEELQTGRSDRVLVAVEETRVGFHRRIRAATSFDRDLASGASETVALSGEQFDVPLQGKRRDRRPVSAGYASLRTLFTGRQWAVFVAASRNSFYAVQ